MTCEKANAIDILSYLSSLGFQPKTIRNSDHWYFSPFRNERTPSFKVNTKLNCWYDHGLGKGGSLIDFGILFHHCSVRELLEKLTNFSFHPHLPAAQIPRSNADEKSQLRIQSVNPIISSPWLKTYLDERKIPLDIANQFCSQVGFELYNSPRLAIGFQNDKSGYELRSADFKGSSSPKDVTFVDNKSQSVSVFEGFIDFLSWYTMNPSEGQLSNFLVLNSLAFFEKKRPLMDAYEKVNLFLDRDKAGIVATRKAVLSHPRYNDRSKLYKGYKDLNDKLTGIETTIKQTPRLSRRF
ncbi:MAG: DNA primase [Flavobacterium sp.]|nr:MAG: DNA primase [Flavobacterium sp.]